MGVLGFLHVQHLMGQFELQTELMGRAINRDAPPIPMTPPRPTFIMQSQEHPMEQARKMRSDADEDMLTLADWIMLKSCYAWFLFLTSH